MRAITAYQPADKPLSVPRLGDLGATRPVRVSSLLHPVPDPGIFPWFNTNLRLVFRLTYLRACVLVNWKAQD